MTTTYELHCLRASWQIAQADTIVEVRRPGAPRSVPELHRRDPADRGHCVTAAGPFNCRPSLYALRFFVKKGRMRLHHLLLGGVFAGCVASASWLVHARAAEPAGGVDAGFTTLAQAGLPPGPEAFTANAEITT